jgi:hypothetical protein
VPLLATVRRLFSLAGEAVAAGDARFWGIEPVSPPVPEESA